LSGWIGIDPSRAACFTNPPADPSWPGELHIQIIEIAGICFELFRARSGDETILAWHETIFGFWRRTSETEDGYQTSNA
jgi:hypothetical protein